MHWTVSLIHFQIYRFDKYPKSLFSPGIINPPLKCISVRSLDESCTSMSGWNSLAVGEVIVPLPTLLVLLERGRVGVRR